MVGEEYHPISLASPGAAPRTAALPLLPGALLPLAAVRRHFPRAGALHYLAGGGQVVSLSRVRGAALDLDTGALVFTQDTAFILPFFDTEIVYIVTEGDADETEKQMEEAKSTGGGLENRVELLKGRVGRQEEALVGLEGRVAELVTSTMQQWTAATMVEHVAVRLVDVNNNKVEEVMEAKAKLSHRAAVFHSRG